jgi:hypothetical protein
LGVSGAGGSCVGKALLDAYDPLFLPNVGKVGASPAGLYGCFSPHARKRSMVTAPVMQIMPHGVVWWLWLYLLLSRK